jgi:Na+/melibiose symporter-like transporter
MKDAPPLNWITRHGYGLGAIVNGTKGAAFSTYLMLFYNQVIGVPAAVVGTAIALTLVVDAIVDPFIGRWSDVFRSRWGRRHPFIYGSALPTALFFLLAWFPPASLTDFQYGMWIFFTAAVTRASVSLNEIPSSAMATELTEDYTQRTKLFSLRYFWGYAGTYGYTGLSLALFFVATANYPRGQLNPDSYPPFAILGACLILIGALASGLATHSRIPYLRQSTSQGGSIASHFREMRQAVNNRAFLAIFGFGVCKWTAIGINSATTLYFATYLFKLDGASLAILTLDGFVAAMLAAPLAPIASRMIGKRNASMYFALFGVCLGLSPLLLAYLDLFMEPGHPWVVPTLFVIGAIYGAAIAISLINTSAMVADVVEDSAVKTGRHTAGIFFAAASFMSQCSIGLGIFMAGLILTWSDFPEKADPAQVTDAMVKSLLIHYIPTVLALWAVGILILLFYPITQRKHEENVARLRAMGLP